MSELKATLKFSTGMNSDASLINIVSNCKEMVLDDIYECGVYDWMAYNLGVEIPERSIISLEVHVVPSYWDHDIDEIEYSIIDGTFEHLKVTKLEADNAELKEKNSKLMFIIENGLGIDDLQGGNVEDVR